MNNSLSDVSQKTDRAEALHPTPARAIIAGIQSSHQVRPEKQFVKFRKNETGQSIVERFEQQVSRNAHRLAIKTGQAHLTYDELNRAANRIARAIIQLRGHSSEPVALLFAQGAHLISAIFGALKAGKPYVALDASFAHSKNSSIIAHCRPGLVITDGQHFHMARKLVENATQLLDIDKISRFSPENLDVYIPPETPAYIIYTSGSTGEPKGVCQDHRNVLHNVMRCTNMLHLAQDDRLSLLWSCSFAASVPNVFGALLNGAALFPFDIKKEGVQNLAGWLAKEEITVYHSVPTVYRHFIAALSGGEDFSKLRLIKLSGEPVLKRDFELYKKHFHEGCIFHVSYASTETNIIRQFFCDHQTEFSGSIAPAGYEVEDMEIFILGKDGKIAVANQAGEIVVRSPFLPRAYFRKEDQAGSPFVPDETRPGWRIFRTGDTGYMQPDGCLIHLGREDQQLKIRGYRVETGEIEMAIRELVAEIEDAVVTGRDDGQGGKFLAAYIVLKKGKFFTSGQLRNLLKARLPDYMIPSRFVFIECLPLTLSGKVDRRALPDPGEATTETGAEYAAPATRMEKLLAGIWSSLLGLERIGVNDNFFDLGGHSLLVARMAVEIKKMTGRTIPVASLLQSPTISQLAGVLEAEGLVLNCNQVIAHYSGKKIPFFWIGISGHRPPYLAPDQPVYGVVLQGDYGKPATYKSIEELASYHLKEIRSAQPKGPYLLGGYCFSGLVALEMAQQLIRAGEDVPLLCLIEPMEYCLPKSGNGNGKGHHISKKSKLKTAGKKLSLLRHSENRMVRLNFITKTLKWKINYSICRALLSFGRPVPRLYRDFYRLHTSRCYVPERFPGRAAVFLMENRSRSEWDGFALNGTYVHEVPGTLHHTMMDEPYAGSWTGLLNSYIQEAASRPEP